MTSKLEQIIKMQAGEIIELTNPLKKAVYKKDINSIEKPKRIIGVRTPRNTKMICEICGNSYTRSNKSNHEKTSLHKAMAKANQTLKKAILGN